MLLATVASENISARMTAVSVITKELNVNKSARATAACLDKRYQHCSLQQLHLYTKALAPQFNVLNKSTRVTNSKQMYTCMTRATSAECKQKRTRDPTASQ
jgi:hypothetical protein